MRQSFVGVLFDQLAHAGRGTFGKLDRCVTRTCDYFAIQTEEPTRRKWRNMAFRYLRCTGYLDVLQASSTSEWSAAPSTLVERGDGDFVLIGDSFAAERVVTVLGGKRTAVIHGAERPFAHGNTPFYPDLLRVMLPARDVARVASEASVAVSPRYQERLAAAVPSLDVVLSTVLAVDASGPAFEQGTTDRLDLPSGAWQPYNEPRPFEPGLFRRSFRHAQPEYALAVERAGGGLEVSSVLASEWAFVAAMAKLRHALALRYERRHQRLAVSRKHHGAGRLPTLVERLLRAGTLLNPSVTADWFSYGGLTDTTITAIRSLLPFANIEVGA